MSALDFVAMFFDIRLPAATSVHSRMTRPVHCHTLASCRLTISTSMACGNWNRDRNGLIGGHLIQP